ncbi:MAG: hypothetical protein IIC73_03715, partial [Armatimonadetes bacterium]|nr:hypothetical protein [Armatimonadota bacterium]
MYKVHVRRTIVMAVLGLVAGVAVFVLTPKVYEARLEMLLGTNTNPSRSQINVISPDVQEIIERNSPQGLLTERQLLSSETVFYQALASAAPDLLDDWEDYYLMFDVVTARTPNQAEQGAGVAQIRVRTHDPRVSERVADAIAASYNTERRNAAVAANNDAVSYLDAQIEASRQAVADAEQAYEDYKREISIAMIEKTMMVETDFRATLISSMESARAQLEGVEARIDSLDGQVAELPDTILDSESDVRSPEIRMVEAEIVGLEGALAIESAKYTGVNPKIKVLNASIADARGRLAIAEQDPMAPNVNTTRKSPRRSALELELSLARAKRADLIGTLDSYQRSLVEQDKVLAGTPAKEVMIAKLDRDRQVFVGKYRRLKTQLEELQNRSETGLKAAVVLGDSGARAGISPVAPDFVKLAFIGLIAGAAVGLVMSFSLESMRPRVYTSAQLADLTGLQVVASIPVLPGLSRSRAV